MKKSEDPCADFYEYSCGRYIDKYLPIRNISSSVYIDRFTSLRENNTRRAKVIIEGMGNTKDPFFRKAYTYYSACINSKRSMDAYFRAADDIGGSDITTIGPFSYTSWDLETALKKMKVQYNANPLFTIHVGHDLFNASRNILLVSRNYFGLAPVSVDMPMLLARSSLLKQSKRSISLVLRNSYFTALLVLSLIF